MQFLKKKGSSLYLCLVHKYWNCYRMDKQETKLLQYADDTTVVLSDKEFGYKLFQLLDKF